MRFSISRKLNIGTHRLLFAALLGVIFGLSVYSYWLVDVFPSTSRVVFICSILAGFVGALGYFALLELWVIPRFSEFQKAEQWMVMLWGTLIGIGLMFAGTSAWTSPARYLNFLLPGQNLEITVLDSKDGSAPENSILWITTSLGDVSYDSMQYDGWVRDKNHLVLKRSSGNIIRWQGKTGDEITILFRKSPDGGTVNISWNGDLETISLKSPVTGTIQYRHKFDVPLYASSVAVQLLVLINFVMAGIALYILFLSQKLAVEKFIVKSVAMISTLTRQNEDFSKDVIIIVFVILLAFLLRIFNLENLYPYADEYNHLIAAKEILEGASLNAVYQRSLFTVTLPVVASYAVFGESLWAARLPGVIFNVLGIIPLYLITRRMNRQIAVLSCLLFAISPYTIAFSRNLREYAYSPFYFYWVAYLIMRFLQGFPQNFVFFRDWKKLHWKYLILSLSLLLPILYVLVIDRFSTFKLILITYGVFGIFLLAKFDLRNRGNRFVIVTSLAGIFVVIIKSIRQFLSIPSIDLRSLEYFFLNPPQQWYFDRLVVLPVLVILAGVWLAYILRDTTFVPMLLCLLCIVYMLFFIFLFKETGFNIHPRFVLAVHIWFVPIVAMGMYTVWVFLLSLFNGQRSAALLLTCIFIALTFNPRQILLPALFQGEFMPVTNLVHDDLKTTNDYMLGQSNGDEVLVGSMYADYAQWQGTPAFEQIYSYSNSLLRNNKDGYSYIASIIERYPAGWIVIDEQRLDYVPPSLPKTQTIIYGKTVEYVGKFQSQHIWRWRVK